MAKRNELRLPSFVYITYNKSYTNNIYHYKAKNPNGFILSIRFELIFFFFTTLDPCYAIFVSRRNATLRFYQNNIL